jgi:hypothetical protein
MNNPDKRSLSPRKSPHRSEESKTALFCSKIMSAVKTAVQSLLRRREKPRVIPIDIEFFRCRWVEETTTAQRRNDEAQFALEVEGRRRLAVRLVYHHTGAYVYVSRGAEGPEQEVRCLEEMMPFVRDVFGGHFTPALHFHRFLRPLERETLGAREEARGRDLPSRN